jgi:hypothetical protein
MNRTVSGYVATTVGAAAGGVALGVVGAEVGGEFGTAHAEPGLFDFALPLAGLIVGFFAGVWIGAVLCSWLTLRLFGYPDARATATALGCLLPIGFALSSLAAVTIFLSLWQRFFDPWSGAGMAALLLVPLLPVPPLARALAQRVGSKRSAPL